MGSLREWHELSEIEQSFARCVYKAATQPEMEGVVDGLKTGSHVAVKLSIHGGWFIYEIPEWAYTT